jgi:plasmid stability protein
MATLYVRDVPERLYEWLRARARQNGRSADAEMLEILADTLARDSDSKLIACRLAELAECIDLPREALRPEEIIRRDRSSR